MNIAIPAVIVVALIDFLGFGKVFEGFLAKLGALLAGGQLRCGRRFRICFSLFSELSGF